MTDAAWQQRWDEAWRGVGALGALEGDAGGREAVLDALLARYAEPQRHYHTLGHLEECFTRFEQVRSRMTDPSEVAVALLYHDAVYDPRAADNEARSAELAVAEMRRRAASPAAIEGVRDMILATRHAESPSTSDAALLLDIDLGILAADEARFDEYEREVRAEYAWVPGILFRRKRREILEGFLARGRIFTSGAFDADEAPARANLTRSIGRL